MSKQDEGTFRLPQEGRWKAEKLQWVGPELTVHGTIETITAGCNKTYGSSDGFTFMGQAIVCVSS